MIKLFAAVLMLIDHIGYILFPNVEVFRIVGRLSMPLFAYCVARGFYFSNQKGTLPHYIKNMAVFAAVSEIPYAVASYGNGKIGLNIGFTWLLALALLYAVTRRDKLGAYISVIIGVFLLSLFAPVDYKIYGVLLPTIFYLSFYCYKRPAYGFYGMCGALVLYMLAVGKSSAMQIFSLAAFPLLLLLVRYDDKVRLPKRFFYWFYPAHLSVLLAIKYVFLT